MAKVTVLIGERTDGTGRQNIMVRSMGGTELFRFTLKEQLDRWCKLTGVSLTRLEDIDLGKLGSFEQYETSQILGFYTFHNVKDIPTDSIKCKGLVGQHVVDCYVRVDGDVTIFYTPYEYRTIIYKPLSSEEQNLFLLENGTLNIPK